MDSTVTAVWATATALWIPFCALVGLPAKPAPDTGALMGWLAVLMMATIPPFAVDALGFGQMFRRS